MSQEVIQVAAGLLFKEGRLLITQRRLHDHLGGLWEFPGGKLEANESFESCLIRELQEELGITVAVGPEIDDITHDYPSKTVRLKFFKCTLLHGEPVPIHCHALTWVTRATLSDYQFPAADEKLLAILENSPSLWE